VLALKATRSIRRLEVVAITDHVAATSVGIVGGVPMIDLCYDEDSKAEVDMNVVMTRWRALRRAASHG